jgi:hypothetical protein
MEAVFAAYIGTIGTRKRRFGVLALDMASSEIPTREYSRTMETWKGDVLIAFTM